METKRFYPNTTQVPNFVLDEVMRHYSNQPSKFFVLMAIIRKTYGWMKDRDRLSLSQIQELTGLSRNSVRNALKGLINDKMIEMVKKGNGIESTVYRCIVTETESIDISPKESKRVNGCTSRGSMVAPLENEGGQSLIQRGSTIDLERVNGCTSRGSMVAPTKPNKPNLNLNIKPRAIPTFHEVIGEESKVSTLTEERNKAPTNFRGPKTKEEIEASRKVSEWMAMMEEKLYGKD